MNGRPALPPSPPHSVTRSSTATSMYSVAGNGGIRKYSQHVVEEQLHQHHRALKEFLAQSIREDKAYQPHNRARDKLLRLSTIQFQELSTDVYDELLRREDERQVADPTPGSESRVPKYLLPKNNFHPKRNQARQKLSTLAAKKFRELATDVLFELERRYPQFSGGDLERITSPSGSTRSMATTNGGHHYGPGARRPSAASSTPPYSPGLFDSGDRGFPSGGPGAEYGRPLPKTFHADTMVPNKGTMVEDDDDEQSIDDDASAYARSSRRTTGISSAMRGRDSNIVAENLEQISRLEQRIRDLEAQLRQKDEEVAQKHEELTQKTEELAQKDEEVAQKDEELASKNEELDRTRTETMSLQQEMEAEQSTHAEVKSDLETRLQSAEHLNSSLREEVSTLQETSARSDQADLDEWKTRYDDLEREFHEQQQLTAEVRQEASQNLQEMRMLAEQNEQAIEHEESLMNQVSHLENEVSDWKDRYAKTKTQLRNLRATSMALYIDNPNAAQHAKDPGFHDPEGIIKDMSITRFQMAIDELLQIAHSQDSSAVLDQVRNVVVCVRSVADDIDAASSSGPQDSIKKRGKLKARTVAACNNMVSAARTFGNSKGLSPVSVVDAAATNLTAAVVELVKFAKVRSTPSGELDDEDDRALA